jgi:dynein light chain 1, axonemal
LALSRNNIKSLSGIESVAETLEQLWASYNLIDKLKGLQALKKLRILYISCNLVKDWPEYARLNEVPNLEEVCFFGKKGDFSIENLKVGIRSNPGGASDLHETVQ